jgi:hypothetical protein
MGSVTNTVPKEHVSVHSEGDTTHFYHSPQIPKVQNEKQRVQCIQATSKQAKKTIHDSLQNKSMKTPNNNGPPQWPKVLEDIVL